MEKIEKKVKRYGGASATVKYQVHKEYCTQADIPVRVHTKLRFTGSLAVLYCTLLCTCSISVPGNLV